MASDPKQLELPLVPKVRKGLYLHLKSGNLYEVLGQGLLEKDLTPVVIYHGQANSEVWVRPIREFMDGRFRFVEDHASN